MSADIAIRHCGDRCLDDTGGGTVTAFDQYGDC